MDPRDRYRAPGALRRSLGFSSDERAPHSIPAPLTHRFRGRNIKTSSPLISIAFSLPQHLRVVLELPDPNAHDCT